MYHLVIEYVFACIIPLIIAESLHIIFALFVYLDFVKKKNIVEGTTIYKHLSRKYGFCISLYGSNYIRIQGLTLMTSGCDIDNVLKIIRISRLGLYKIKKRAIECGFDPTINPDRTINPRISAIHVQDAMRSGRPAIYMERQEDTIRKKVRLKLVKRL